MRCKNCGKEIEEDETFCNDCKKEMKSISSRKEVEQLEELIEDNNNLNELEKTKELFNLDNLEEEEPSTEELNDEIKDDEKSVKEFETRESRANKNKKSKKKMIIILSIIFAVLVAIVIMVVLFLNNKPEEEVKEKPINYEKIINDYGKLVENIVSDYTKKNSIVPTWQQVSELLEYDKYEVVCNVHSIYQDGKVYLDSCKINDKDIEFSYGVLQEEVKEGKKIDIYKLTYEDNRHSYIDKKSNGSTSVGSITCETLNCTFIVAYDKYVLIKEDDKYKLYNYENNSIEFGPFDLSNDYSTDMLSYDNVLYGVYYKENNIANIYNVSTGKTFKNIKGKLLLSELNFEPSIMYKHNYVIFENNRKYDFVNLKTGNVSYSIKGNLNSFIEDTKNNIVYMTSYDSSNKQFNIINSNGKLLFDGEKFEKINVGGGNLIVSKNKSYQVYDSKLRLKTSSKEYDEILGLYDDFIVVVDNNHLEILDINDNVLATFDFEWNSNRYHFNTSISGYKTINGKYGIYLVIEDEEISKVLYYYYIPDTKEINVLEDYEE